MTHDIYIRVAEIKDAPILSQMITKLSNYENSLHSENKNQQFSYPSALETIELEKENRGWHNFVAYKNNGELIGFCRGTINKNTPNSYGYLKQLYVDEQYRGKKIGKKLMLEFAQLCLIFKVDNIIISTDINNIKAINFYKNLSAKVTTSILEVSPLSIKKQCEEYL